MNFDGHAHTHTYINTYNNIYTQTYTHTLHYNALYIEPADDGGKKPAARVDAAVRSVEGVAKREGLSPDLIDTLMDFVGGEGGGSERSGSW